MINKIVRDTNATGEEEMNIILTEGVNACNELSRHGGFAPSQWVLGKLPRTPAMQGDEEEAFDIGTIQGHIDGASTFGIQSRYRAKARECFVRWDCGQKMQRALLRKAAPITGQYEVGDIVSYCRNTRKGEKGLQWSTGSKIIGFERSKQDKSQENPKTCWVLCDGVPVCVGTDKIRPCTAPELLAYNYTFENDPNKEIISETRQQLMLILEKKPQWTLIAGEKPHANQILKLHKKNYGLSSESKQQNNSRRQAMLLYLNVKR